MLCIHVLNVGNGDSLVLEFQNGANRSFAVVDSNQQTDGDPPALRKLRELGAERLSFVALTHPHADHYKGLSKILEAYRGNIDAFYTFPIWGHMRGRLPRYAKLYHQIALKSDSPTVIGRTEEFIKILFEAKSHIGDWQQQTGLMNQVFAAGFDDVQIHVLLPPARVNGRLFSMLDKGDPAVVEDSSQELNDLSLAFLLTYAGKRLILGGDGSYKNWIYHSQIAGRQHTQGLRANAVKIPHHGSYDDCKKPVLDYLFAPDGDRIACVSADGHRHPHPDFYTWLEERDIKPYCTNLAKTCGARIRGLIPAPNLDPALTRFINAVAQEPTPHSQMPCQGDIRISVSPAGDIAATPQYAHPCPYRGGYDFLRAAPAPAA